MQKNAFFEDPLKQAQKQVFTQDPKNDKKTLFFKK